MAGTRQHLRDGRPGTAGRVSRNSEASSTASAPGVCRRMQGQPTCDTKPRVALRRLLPAGGLHSRSTGHRCWACDGANLVLGPARVEVFVDGCSWRGCPDYGPRPRSNERWWQAKLERNRLRDADTIARLESAGWRVARDWEHEAPAAGATRIREIVLSRAPSWDSRGRVT